jgi:ParB-like chromosome segregation protein Spo0J
MKNDLSFWGDSWCWNKSDRAYGNKPEDSWFINPTPKLVGEVMAMAPIVHGQCEVMLLDKHKDELDVERQRQRHLEFLRVAQDNELVSECLDMLKAYQGRYFEAVQQYLGRVASYENQKNRQDASDTDVEKSEARKLESAAVCRRNQLLSAAGQLPSWLRCAKRITRFSQTSEPTICTMISVQRLALVITTCTDGVSSKL